MDDSLFIFALIVAALIGGFALAMLIAGLRETHKRWRALRASKQHRPA